MRRAAPLLVLLFVAAPALAERGWLRFNEVVADLPGSCTKSRSYWVRDGANATDCVTGGGSVIVECICNANETSYTGRSLAGGGASDFVGLSDTPANLTGSGLRIVRVNTGETALEFADTLFLFETSEPADPSADGQAVVWLSDGGEAYYNAGDLVMKIRQGGVTKSFRLVPYNDF